MNHSTLFRAFSRTSQQSSRTPRLPLRTIPPQRCHLHCTTPFILRKRLPAGGSIATPIRSLSTEKPEQEIVETKKPLTDRKLSAEEDTKTKEEIAARKAEQPSYQLTFTCAKCLDRSSHRISKQSYHFGTVVVTCPGCKNKHLISDHLKIFSDRSVTLEDIMKEKGELVKKGVLGSDGDVEFYEEPKEPV